MEGEQRRSQRQGNKTTWLCKQNSKTVTGRRNVIYENNQCVICMYQKHSYVELFLSSHIWVERNNMEWWWIAIVTNLHTIIRNTHTHTHTHTHTRSCALHIHTPHHHTHTHTHTFMCATHSTAPPKSTVHLLYTQGRSSLDLSPGHCWTSNLNSVCVCGCLLRKKSVVCAWNHAAVLLTQSVFLWTGDLASEPNPPC